MNDSITPEIPAKPPKPLWRRIAKWTLRVVVVLVVALVLTWSVWNFLAARALNKEIAKIRAAGEPLTFADLAASLPKVDEADDAGPYYTAALALLRRENQHKFSEISDSFSDAVEEGTPPPSGLIADAERLIEDNRLALEMLDLGSAMPGCNYDIAIEYGTLLSLPRLSSARSLAKVLSLRTRLLALQRQADQAVESAISSLRMLRMFERQPILICHLLKLACLQVVTKDVPVILELAKPSAEMLGRLESSLLKTEQSLNLKRVYLAERVYSMELMRNVLGRSRTEIGIAPQPPLRGQWPSNPASAPVIRTFAAHFLQTLSQLIDAGEGDWPEVLEAVRLVGRQDFSIWNVFGRIFAPPMERSTVVQGQILAEVRSARLALMIERYRSEKGKLPDSLADLEAYAGAKLPLDPFTGKSLIYRKSDSEYLVYSIGDDLKDNGGPIRDRASGTSDDKPKDWGVRIRISPP